MRNKLPWWTIYIAVVTLPFLIVLGSYQLALLVPGTLRTLYWEHLGSVFFLLAIPISLFVLLRAQAHWSIRIPLGLGTAYLLLMATLALQAQWKCGEHSSEFIGLPTQKTMQVASCT